MTRMHGCAIGIDRFSTDILLDSGLETALIEELIDHVPYIKVALVLDPSLGVSVALIRSIVTAADCRLLVRGVHSKVSG